MRQPARIPDKRNVYVSLPFQSPPLPLGEGWGEGKFKYNRIYVLTIRWVNQNPKRQGSRGIIYAILNMGVENTTNSGTRQ